MDDENDVTCPDCGYEADYGEFDPEYMGDFFCPCCGSEGGEG